MAEPQRRVQLHILIANEHPERLQQVEAIVRGLGHTVTASATNPGQAAQSIREQHPDVALVGLGQSREHALALIRKLVRRANCPVIALLRVSDPFFVAEDKPDDFASAIALARTRFAAYQSLEGAFARRALIERAKGILMERHQLNERAAFDMLRRHSHHTGRKLAEVATAITDSHLLLPHTAAPAPDETPPL